MKDAQAQMRHSRASTTLDIYRQFVPESQRLAVDRLTVALGARLAVTVSNDQLSDLEPNGSGRWN